MNLVEIIEAIDNNVEKIRTKSLDLSFNELLDMYDNQELIIDPDYQRLFRWSNEKQSRFMESLLLEMPVPPIFVIETEDNVYELIDGLQRISSYLHFRGIIINENGEKEENFLKLCGCDMIEGLNSLSYNDLPKAIQVKLKRTFIRVEVLRKASDKSLRYHMFKRLNTGGEQLSSQEVRNCTIRLLDEKFMEFIIKCSNHDSFKAVIGKIKKVEISQKIDHELVLRFFALKNNLEEYRYPFNEFLTEYMEKVSGNKMDFDYNQEEKIFNTTFDILNQLLGTSAFSSLLKSGKYKDEFTLYYFDAFSLGVQKYLEELRLASEEINGKIIKRFQLLKQGEFASYTTGTKGNIQKRIEIVENGIKEVLWS
ncbi:DUF262 domain-containing protein [Clostridium estertheticum]|uniref:DUF262 domain-containing protein n=1 Tax=Clostridium estertheticum TaxID=238834 RepID=UPI001C0D087A|nr:DUF262 domain-containing protein [Clostridium estertheticum]MBU3201739.1 DUF262 domain-containing protein [Clostridium estertheticum]WAG67131.1 DUF262 domain-containing protein [Clostridium estertheticum]